MISQGAKEIGTIWAQLGCIPTSRFFRKKKGDLQEARAPSKVVFTMGEIYKIQHYFGCTLKKIFRFFAIFCHFLPFFVIRFPCLEVEILFSWLWAKRCVFAGMRAHCSVRTLYSPLRPSEPTRREGHRASILWQVVTDNKALPVEVALTPPTGQHPDGTAPEINGK